jgi:hypothetical protein
VRGSWRAPEAFSDDGGSGRLHITHVERRLEAVSVERNEEFAARDGDPIAECKPLDVAARKFDQRFGRVDGPQHRARHAMRDGDRESTGTATEIGDARRLHPRFGQRGNRGSHQQVVLASRREPSLPDALGVTFEHRGLRVAQSHGFVESQSVHTVGRHATLDARLGPFVAAPPDRLQSGMRGAAVGAAVYARHACADGSHISSLPWRSGPSACRNSPSSPPWRGCSLASLRTLSNDAATRVE